MSFGNRTSVRTSSDGKETVEDVAGGGMRKAAPPEEECAREAAAEGGAHRGLQKQLQKF